MKYKIGDEVRTKVEGKTADIDYTNEFYTDTVFADMIGKVIDVSDTKVFVKIGFVDYAIVVKYKEFEIKDNDHKGLGFDDEV